jgi:uncharacterized membrane protein
VLVNLLAINLAGLGVFWYLGYRPPTWLGIEHSRKTVLKRSGILLLLLLVVSIPLVVTTNSKIQGAQLEDRIETDVREVVDRPQYADVVVESVRVEKDPSDVTHPPKRVVVVLGIPSDTHYPELSPEVAGAIIGRTSQDVGVRVEFVHVDEPIRNE